MRRARLRLIDLAGCALLGACNNTSDLAPATPDTPAPFRSSEEATTTPTSPAVAAPRFRTPPNSAVQFPSAADINPKHVYSLVELIDIAQLRNPATRVAWEEARQAANKVGIARSAYLPALTASAVAGYERAVFPFPKNLVPQGFITSNNQEVVPQLSVKYLLLDFGGRAAEVEEAGQLSIASNAEFTAAHQKLIFSVVRAYFMLDGANAGVRAARKAVSDAQVLQQSTEALYGRGLGTVADIDRARRGTAQAEYDLSQISEAQHAAMSALLGATDHKVARGERIRAPAAAAHRAHRR